MTTLTKRYGFSASHRLHTSALSEEENCAVFGKCANPHGHGHNYWLEVSVSGDADPGTGLLMRRSELDRWVTGAVIERIDRTYMNDDLVEFREMVPTTENLAIVIGQWLRDGWANEFSERPMPPLRVRIEETPRNSFVLSSREESKNN